MTRRPLPKTVAPLPDELLSGWLTRLAASNYSEPGELLAHVGLDCRHADTLDFELNAEAAERIAVAARVSPGLVQSLIFPAMPPIEAQLTAQVPFQRCPVCSRRGFALKHWRRAWAFDCQKCGARLLPILARSEGEVQPEQLLRRARGGAGLLEQAIKSDRSMHLRRAMRAVIFAMALRAVRGDPVHALQSPRPEVRLFCLAAIAAAQSRPLFKAAMFSTGIDDFAYAALLRTYEKEPRLLATIGRIVERSRRMALPPEAESHN